MPLKVWQMTMPEELSLPVQRVLRTMISGIMLVQCFTVYVYLASYIVLLYPVFLEERPTLVLPWLLLAAIRKLLCELTSLALGLGTCVLLGAARPPCIKFVVIKVISIMPSFYMWMLVYGYYHVLKVASVFKTFPVVLPPSEHDYGLELAVRRRRTKSLLGEEQLRRRLLCNVYNERHSLNPDVLRPRPDYSSRMSHATDTSAEDNTKEENDIMVHPLSTTSNRIMSDTGCYDECFGSEVMVPRDSDRILEQFGVMMLRIGAYISKEGNESATSQILNSATSQVLMEHRRSNHDCTTMPPDDTDTPLLVGNSKGRTASYLRDYPQIFGKKPSDIPLHSDMTITLTSDARISPSQLLRNQSQVNENNNTTDNNKCSSSSPSDEAVSVETETPSTSKKLSNTSNQDVREITQNKIQSGVSSERSVNFKDVKKKISFTQRLANESKQKENGTSESENNKSINLEEKDSLESIIEGMQKHRSLKTKSLNKDKNDNKARAVKSNQHKKSSVTILSDDEESSADSLTSNKSKTEKRE
ncbi:uncharacterized protein LOC135074529 isoform X2 [Ostrinia nubilalis]|uniref:uncharacterized protein LOC135074529 isoform X2 n=1 Tax=Ostrinia nubilalis TaxID=29057 RepID=UPI003082612B